MFQKRITYLKFLIKSTNQHGVHSPFVFDYLTKCLYKKPRQSKNKTVDTLLKSYHYFNAKNIKIVGSLAFEKEIEKNLSIRTNALEQIDILYFESVKNISQQYFFEDFKLTNESIVLINNIYKTPLEHELWQKLIQQKEISVSIDLYYCGVLSFRKEQEKEHFTIRI